MEIISRGKVIGESHHIKHRYLAAWDWGDYFPEDAEVRCWVDDEGALHHTMLRPWPLLLTKGIEEE